MPRATPHITLRVVLYFAFAPEEELTSKDMRAKFGDHVPTKRSFGTYLRTALQRGLLRKWRAPGMGLVFGAGPVLLEMVKGKVR